MDFDTLTAYDASAADFAVNSLPTVTPVSRPIATPLG